MDWQTEAVVVGWARLSPLAVRNEHALELGAGLGGVPGNVWHRAKKIKRQTKTKQSSTETPNLMVVLRLITHNLLFILREYLCLGFSAKYVT